MRSMEIFYQLVRIIGYAERNDKITPEDMPGQNDAHSKCSPFVMKGWEAESNQGKNEQTFAILTGLSNSTTW